MKRQKGSKWSNSRINTFQTCARQYKYKYIEKDNKEEFISISIIVGSVYHSILEYMYKDYYLKGIIPFEDIQKIFEIEWDKKLAREKNKGREIVYHDEIKDDKIYKKYTFDCIKRYYDKFYVTGIETSFDSCKTEEIVEPEFEDENGRILSFKGFIDRYDIQDNVLTIVDYKTSRQAPKDTYLDKALKQLYLYALGIIKDERFKLVRDINIKLIYPFPGVKIERKVKKKDLEDAKDFYVNLIDLIRKEKKWIQSPGYHCKSCGFQKICPEFKYKFKLKESLDELDIKDLTNLIDQLVILKDKSKEINKQIDNIKNTIIKNKSKFMDGDSEGRFIIPGTETGSEAVVNIEKVPKIPDSQDSMREIMIKEIIDKGLWEEIATLNSISVNPKLKKKQYSNELMEVLNMYIYEDEETSRITLRKSNEKK